MLAAAVLFMAVHTVHAKRDQYGDEVQEFPFDENLVEKWKESPTVIPSYPNDADLIAVPANDTDTLKIYLDRKSISRAPDLVLRYTLVVQSRSGARSVFYDGLRCETRQYKTYAIGTENHLFEPATNPQWQTIPRPEINAFRYQLYSRYFCNENSSARAPDEIVRLLK
ncbi:MAG TPA: CNP1-like family protein [Candidatus Methylomirabilis sp.]|nr:CNP1-like family protein [Candidatus Methylomirabilis sp.]